MMLTQPPSSFYWTHPKDTPAWRAESSQIIQLFTYCSRLWDAYLRQWHMCSEISGCTPGDSSQRLPQLADSRNTAAIAREGKKTEIPWALVTWILALPKVAFWEEPLLHPEWIWAKVSYLKAQRSWRFSGLVGIHDCCPSLVPENIKYCIFPG